MQRGIGWLGLLLSLVVVNAVLIGFFVLTLNGTLNSASSTLPGDFGGGLYFWQTNRSGNNLILALILAANAVLVLFVGWRWVMSALAKGLPVKPGTLAEVLTHYGITRGTADAVTGALQEEQRGELRYLRSARRVMRAGFVLFVVAFPLLCLAYARALGDDAAPLFVDAAGRAFANSTLALADLARFTADQLAGALLFDIPEIYGRHIGVLQYNADHPWFVHAIFLFRFIVGGIAITGVVAYMRSCALKSYLHKWLGPTLVDAASMQLPGKTDAEHAEEDARIREALRPSRDLSWSNEYTPEPEPEHAPEEHAHREPEIEHREEHAGPTHEEPVHEAEDHRVQEAEHHANGVESAHAPADEEELPPVVNGAAHAHVNGAVHVNGGGHVNGESHVNGEAKEHSAEAPSLVATLADALTRPRVVH